ALKVTRGYYKEYFPPKEILKMATVNGAKALNIDTGYIEEDKFPDLIILKQKSKDPILSIINRTEPQDIKNMILDGNLIF
ncbi:MAG: amidohydrolase family protein, partial [Methanobacterium sp.]